MARLKVRPISARRTDVRSGPPRGPRCLAPRRWISAALCVKLVRQVELTSCEMFPCSRAEVVVDESRTLANVFLMLKVCTNSIPVRAK